jgi:1,4-dihydroxy-2-naphthoate octaprenyltransferase
VNKWIAGARQRTLPAAIVPVLVGTACAVGVTGAGRGIVWWRAIAALLAAVFIQVGTNFANDYSDGKRGTDDPGQRVGPPRLVGWGLASPEAVKRAAIGSFALAGVAGLALAIAVDWRLVFVGAASFAAGWLYTGGPKPYGYAGFGELFVFLFFGVVATVGSTYVQTERITGLSLAASIPVGLLATALLVTNNLRDIPSDTQVGKRTLAVRLGDHRTRILYVALIVGAFVAVPFVGGLGSRPIAAIALGALLLAQKPVTAVLSGARGPALIPVLVATGRVQLAFGVLFAAGIALSG